MLTRAVRLYHESDLRLEEFALPELKEDEILAEVMTDSLCMSTYKCATQGKRHKKVPSNIDEQPIIVGHEFCGIIRQVGAKWAHQYRVGDNFVLQPNIGVEGVAPGYSFPYIGGDATFVIIMNQAIENGSILPYSGDSFFEGSLVEPLSCVIGAFHANYHYEKLTSYTHVMGIKEGGTMALMGATGPMGFLAIDYAIHGPKKPKKLVVTGIVDENIEMAKRLYPIEEAAKEGVELLYVNTKMMEDVSVPLRALTKDGNGYDDIFVFIPVESVVTQAEQCLAYDGCLNFFSGPSNTNFSAKLNFYNVHYNATHIVGTSGGNTEDMKEALTLIEEKKVNVAKIATHILGLDSVAQTTLELPKLTGGKKIVYTHIDMNLKTIEEICQTDPTIKRLIDAHDGLWNADAEKYLLEQYGR